MKITSFVCDTPNCGHPVDNTGFSVDTRATEIQAFESPKYFVTSGVEDGSGIKHFCGATCVLKYLSSVLSPATESTTGRES